MIDILFLKIFAVQQLCKVTDVGTNSIRPYIKKCKIK